MAEENVHPVFFEPRLAGVRCAQLHHGRTRRGGAWRRDLLVRAGGFSSRTLAEDADLTLSIRRLGYAIAYEDQAIALTEAPDTVGGFVRQRYRWMYGTFQAAWKHTGVLFRRHYGSLGFVALPNIFIFQVLFPLISPVMDLLLVGSLAAAAFDWWQHSGEFQADALWRVRRHPRRRIPP